VIVSELSQEFPGGSAFTGKKKGAEAVLAATAKGGSVPEVLFHG